MKKTINLELKMSELIFDIQNKTYLTGRSLSDGSNNYHVANMQANDDDENESQILRSITNAYAILRNRLAEYLDSDDNSSDNNSLKTTDTLMLMLAMPSNFNPASAKTIGEAAHQFIVSTSVADWFAITAKGETNDYSLVAEASLKTLEEALCKRSRPKRGQD